MYGWGWVGIGTFPFAGSVAIIRRGIIILTRQKSTFDSFVTVTLSILAGTISSRPFPASGIAFDLGFDIFKSHDGGGGRLWIGWDPMSERSRLHGKGPLSENYGKQVAGTTN